MECTDRRRTRRVKPEEDQAFTESSDKALPKGNFGVPKLYLTE
jgi:hypothetical protein